MARHRRRANPPPRPMSVEPEPEHGRAYAWGEAVVLIWYFSGFAALLVGGIKQAGPFGWAAAWQVRRFGYNSGPLRSPRRRRAAAAAVCSRGNR